MKLSTLITSFSLLLIGFVAPCIQAVESERMATVPVVGANGATTEMQVRLCLPEDSNRSQVVILNHGSPPSASDRPLTNGFRCDSEPARWFLHRHFLVVAPIRRGYGATGGAWAEGYGSCNDAADFFHAGLETARDIQATVEYVATLPEALPDHMVVVGQSAGGWGTVAYDSLPHPRVSAMINMAGGRGGHHGGVANRNCRPDLLARAAGQYGRTASTPMLWMYAENDSFFAPMIANALFDAFTTAGGQADFIHAPAFGSDGHLEFTAAGGSAVWGPAFEDYLGRQQ